MTVSVSTNRNEFTGNGSLVAFDYTFVAYSNDSIKVEVDGAEQTTGFTAVRNPNSIGGRVTFSAAPANGAGIVIRREIPLTQSLDLVRFGRFPAESIERALDEGVMVDQQLSERIDNERDFVESEVARTLAKVLNRTDGPNNMEQDILMGNNRIRELAEALVGTDAVNLNQVVRLLETAGSNVLLTYSNEPTPNTAEYSDGQPWIIVDLAESYTLQEGAWVEDGTVGDDVSVTAASYMTLAEAQTSDLKVGQYVRLTDRALGLFRITTDTPNGLDIIDIGGGLSLTLRVEYNCVNVDAVGAVGDNITNDLSAFNRAQELATTVIVSDKEYYIDNGLGASTSFSNKGTGNYVSERNLVAVSGVKVIGAGAGRTKIRLARNSNSFIALLDPAATELSEEVVSYVDWSNMTIEGSYDGTSPDSTNSYGFFGVTKNSKFSHIVFDGFDSDAIDFAGARGGSYDNAVRGCTFRNCGRHGISLVEASNNTIKLNSFDDIIGAGVRLEPDVATQRIESNKITRNKFEGCSIPISGNHFGTAVGRARSGGNVISCNVIKNFSGTSIYMEDFSATTVTDNEITSSTHGIDCANCPDVVVKYNTIKCVTGSVSGISITNSASENSEVVSNKVYAYDASPTHFGIYLENASRADVRNNYIKDAGQSGIRGFSVDKLRLKGNEVNGANRTDGSGNNAGIYIDNTSIAPTHCFVLSNSVYDEKPTPTLYRGLHLRGTYTASVYGSNVVSSNTASAYTGFTGFTLSGANV